MGININNQLETLLEARRSNEELDKEIKKISEENWIWEKKIEYATSSAFLEQEVREKLGMGERNDYWIDLGTEPVFEEKSAFVPPLRNYSEAMPAVTKSFGEAMPIWRQWLELFMVK